MPTLADALVLDPAAESGRLWGGALAALERAREDLASLLEALDLGVRAVEVLAVHRLEPARDRFPATLAMRLEAPDPVVVPERDAASAPPTLRFIEAVDLLSADPLPCAAPALHAGWEDRRFSCLRSRSLARRTAGVSLDGGARDHLVLLAAYRNRLFLLPPPVRVVPSEILGAFPALREIHGRLERGAPA